jgi:hypothetical protein
MEERSGGLSLDSTLREITVIGGLGGRLADKETQEKVT